MVVGILMGDGCIDGSGKNPRLIITMTSPNYLEYVAENFDILGGDVRLYTTAEENAKNSRYSGLNPNADSDNYSDIYRWCSIKHPELEEFAEWYESGGKMWPENIKLTPTVLKHWYCGDGHWNNNGSANYIAIAMLNEVDNLEKVD